MEKYCVYLHENKTNGKKYIGVTSKKPKQRWLNGKGYKTNTYFYSSITKHGWCGFRHKILFKGLTREEAFEKEKELIALYDTTKQEYGYNLSEGGEELSKKHLKKLLRGKKDKTRKVIISSDRHWDKYIVYENLDDASIKTGLDREFLYRCCLKEEISPRGFSIEFDKEYI